MSLIRIGAIPIDFHGNPVFVFDALDRHGFRAGTVSGLFEWPAAEQLSELVANPHRRLTVGQHVGVLEPIWMDDALLVSWRGWYLLGSCAVDGDQPSSVRELVPVRIGAVFLGEPQIVVTRSERARVNDFGLAARALVVDPFPLPQVPANPFARSPGGVVFTREYDPRAHDPRSL